MYPLTFFAKLALVGSSVAFASIFGILTSKGCPCPAAGAALVGAIACGVIGTFLGKVN